MNVHQLFSHVAALAARHHGLVSRGQLRRIGVEDTVIARWVAHGRLERIAPEVYRIAGCPETWAQRVMLATLDTGGWASHRAAAALHGLDGHPGRQVEVVVQRWKRSGRRPGYIVHETKDLKGVDLTTRSGIPSTSLVRTLIDLPAVEHAFRAEQALDHACRTNSGILNPTRQRFVEVARRGRNGTRVMRRLLNERPGDYIPVGSSFEQKALRIIRRLDLPEPIRQLKITDGDFVAFPDISWPPVRFFIECDSLAFHFGKRSHDWDRRRRRRLKRLGWEGIEWTYDDVTQHADEIGRELLQLYRAREASVLASTTSHIQPALTPE
ncbi:MAG: hypothetical protein QOF97_2077 [Acidimicrobiaceae bacterium]